MGKDSLSFDFCKSLANYKKFFKYFNIDIVFNNQYGLELSNGAKFLCRYFDYSSIRLINFNEIYFQISVINKELYERIIDSVEDLKDLLVKNGKAVYII